MTDLIDTTEMYLRTILELEEDGVTPMRARIAERLNHSGPTVSQTINRMQRIGLVVLAEHRQLKLTAEGRAKAVEVMRKHRLCERFLSDVVGLEWELVHEEACRWEHVISERVEQKLLEILPYFATSPYGNIVPGLEELGVGDADGVVNSQEYQEHLSLEMILNTRNFGEGTLVRFGEPAQADESFLAQIHASGFLPGSHVRFRAGYDEDAWAYFVNEPQDLGISREVAAHIFFFLGSPTKF